MQGIKTLSGHLTATNKRVILSMLNQGMLSAKTPKIRYYVTVPADGGTVYSVSTVQNEGNGYGGMLEHRYSATFTVTP
jgi:hypothetical protein